MSGEADYSAAVVIRLEQWNDRVKQCHEEREYHRALRLASRAHSLAKKRLSGDDPIAMSIVNILAMSYEAVGDYPAAEPLYRESLELRRSAYGAEHPAVANAMDNLAGLLAHLGEYDAAKPRYCEALRIRRLVIGKAHEDVATSLNNVGTFLQLAGDSSGAEDCYRQSLEVAERLHGESHHHCATWLNNLEHSFKPLAITQPRIAGCAAHCTSVVASSAMSIQMYRTACIIWLGSAASLATTRPPNGSASARIVF